MGRMRAKILVTILCFVFLTAVSPVSAISSFDTDGGCVATGFYGNTWTSLDYTTDIAVANYIWRDDTLVSKRETPWVWRANVSIGATSSFPPYGYTWFYETEGVHWIEDEKGFDSYGPSAWCYR